MPAKQAVPDLIAKDLGILFVGYNPGLRSGAAGHHFASPSNRFWKLLHDAGLTPRRLKASEDADMLALGYGITNIVPRVTRTAAELGKEEFARGRKRLLALVREYKPRFVCFAGIGVYREYAERQEVACGMQAEPVVPGVTDYVVPSPSGLCRVPYSEQLAWYMELRRLAQGG